MEYFRCISSFHKTLLIKRLLKQSCRCLKCWKWEELNCIQLLCQNNKSEQFNYLEFSLFSEVAFTRVIAKLVKALQLLTLKDKEECFYGFNYPSNIWNSKSTFFQRFIKYSVLILENLFVFFWTRFSQENTDLKSFVSGRRTL